MYKILSIATALAFVAAPALAQPNGAGQTPDGNGGFFTSPSGIGQDNGAYESHDLTYDISEYVWIDLTDDSPMAFSIDPIVALQNAADPTQPNKHDYGLDQQRTVRYATNAQDVVVLLDWDTSGDFPSGDAHFTAQASLQSQYVASEDCGGASQCAAGSFNSSEQNLEGVGTSYEVLSGGSRTSGTFDVVIDYEGDQFVPPQSESDARIVYHIFKQ